MNPCLCKKHIKLSGIKWDIYNHKEVNTQKDITILNGYVPNNRVSKYIKAKLI